MANSPSRNGPCPCGSGKKYKRCCAGRQATQAPAALAPEQLTPAQNLERAGKFQQASDLYSDLLERYKNHPALLWGLGRCLMEAQQPVAAAEALSLASKYYSGNQQLLIDASSRLILLGRPDDALEASRVGAERFPYNVQLLLNRADALRLLGQHAAAIELLVELRKLAPQRTGVVLSLVNSLRNSGQVEHALSTAQSALAELAAEGLDYAGLLNEIAHCQQAFGAYQNAYASASLSGQIILATPQARAIDSNAFFKQIDSYHSWIKHNGLLAAKIPPSGVSTKLVFMVGFPRSGTTLLESMLAAHPQVKTSGEALLLNAAIRSLLPAGSAVHQFQDVLANASSSELALAAEAYWNEVKACFGEDFDCFIDKLPLNTLELPLIRALFPEAKIVFSLRDPRDVCLSCLFQWFALNPAMKAFYSWDSTLELYAGVMSYWLTLEPLLGEAVYPLRYEELVADFPGQIKLLTEYLELPWDDAILSYVNRNQKGYFHTPSNEAVRGQANQSAVERWRYYPDAIAAAQPQLAPIISKLGYR